MYKIVGHKKATTDTQLTRIGRKIFGKDYLGTFPQDVKPNAVMSKVTKGDSYFIINLDKKNKPGVHWIGVYYNTNTDKFYIYDSFARKSSKILPHFIKTIGYKHVDMNGGSDQTDKMEDCGQRSLSYLVFVKKYGIQNARHI